MHPAKTGLVVDIVDARTGKLAWEGVASDTVEGAAEKVAKKIDKPGDKLFE